MDKKKILLLSDDLRMSSGVGTMSKEFVVGTIKHYDWVQIGGAIKHPDEGKIINMNDSIRKELGVEDANLTIYPVSGYGSQQLLREVMSREKPDAILHYTDPRFWGWLYEMEHELRQPNNEYIETDCFNSKRSSEKKTKNGLGLYLSTTWYR